MAEFDKKVVLIEIEVDNSAATKAVDKLTNAIIEQNDAIAGNNDEIKVYNASNKEIEKQVKAGAMSQGQATAAINANNDKIKAAKLSNASLKDELKDLNKERASAVTATKLQSNSLDALRKEVIKQKVELNGLNTGTAEGRKRFDELSEALKRNNEKIKAADQSAGDMKTTIGSYKDEIGNAVGGTKVFGTTLGGLFKMIVLNPVGLLLSALVGLVAIFKETQSGAEFFRKTGAALNVVFGLLKDGVEFLGNALIDAFTTPKKTIDDLYNTIKDGIGYYLNEFLPKAVQKVIDGFGLLGDALSKVFAGDFSGALESAGEGALKLADGLTDLNPVTALVKTGVMAAAEGMAFLAAEIERTTSAAFLLEDALIANEKATANQEVAVAKAAAQQKALNRIIEDQSKGYEERIKAAEQFAAIEEVQVTKSVALAEERLRILKAQNDLTNSTEEDIQRVRDAEINLANLRATSDEKQVTNGNKLFGIKKQQETETLANAAKAVAEQEKLEANLTAKVLALKEFQRSQANELYLASATDYSDFLATKREIEQQDFDYGMELLEEQAEIIKENAALAEEEKQALLAENQLSTEELRAEHKDAMTAIEEEEAAEAIRIQDEKQKAIGKIVSNGVKAVFVIADIANSLVEKRYRKRFAELQKLHESGAISDEEYAKRKDNLEKNAAMNAYRIQLNMFKFQKALDITQIAVNTAVGISNALRTPPAPFGIALAGTIGVLGGLQLTAAALKQPPPPPQFADGGLVINGRSHSQGGEDIHVGGRLVGNMEGNEGLFVTNKMATKQMLNDYNTANGGRSMFSSSSRFLQDGGEVNTKANNENMIALITAAMAASPVPKVEIEDVMSGIIANQNARKIGVIS